MVPLVGLLVICLIMSAQSVRATTVTGSVTFQDLTDTIAVADTTGRTSNLVCGTEAVTCTLELTGPNGTTIGSTSTLQVTYLWSEGAATAQGVGIVSDGLNAIPPGQRVGASIIGLSAVNLTFHSDAPSVTGPEPIGLQLCPGSQPSLFVGCNAPEDGTALPAGTIDWVDSHGNIVETDTILGQSDFTPGELPEPASLILLGSGLVMSGGFLRRRPR